jgi:hypothetical protein
VAFFNKALPALLPSSIHKATALPIGKIPQKITSSWLIFSSGG